MKYAVVGGGVAGLTAALELRERGHQVTLIERDALPGGKVRTDRRDGWQVERGPIAVQDNAPATKELLGQVELGAKVLTADDQARRRFLFLDGKLREVPESPPKLALSSTLSFAEKWRVLREPRAPAAPEGVDETIHDFAARRLGESLAQRFVEPMVTGIFAGDYARLSLRSVFPRIAEIERAHGSLIRGLLAEERQRKTEGLPRTPVRLNTLAAGMGELPLAIGRALGDSLKLGVDVGAITRFGASWTVSTDGGPLEVERVILAVPPDEAARLLTPVDAAMAEAFDAIPQVGVAAVTLGYARASVRHALDGFGFLVPRIEKQRLLGTLFMTSIFPTLAQAPPGHVMLRCMIGGAHDEAAAQLDDAALIEIAQAGLRASVGASGAPAFTHVVRWPRAIPQYLVGHAGRVATIEERGARIGLYATGASLRGVGVNDVVREAKALVARLVA